MPRPAPGGPDLAAEACPRCDTPRVGAFRYCRSCGLDYDALPPPASSHGLGSAREAGSSARNDPAPGASADWIEHLGESDWMESVGEPHWVEQPEERGWTPLRDEPARAASPTHPRWTPPPAGPGPRTRPGREPDTQPARIAAPTTGLETDVTTPRVPEPHGPATWDDMPRESADRHPRRIGIELVLIAAIAAVAVIGGAVLLSPPAGSPTASVAPSRSPAITPTPTRQQLDVFSRTGDLLLHRAQHTATLLRDGRVFVAGGFIAGGAATASTELYDPATGAFAAGPPLLRARDGHAAALLPDGRVLIVGGWSGGTMALGLEVYDPAAGTVMAAGALKTGRLAPDAVLLASGKVLLIGGVDSKLAPVGGTELYDPATGTLTAGAREGTPRAFGSVTVLADGRILVAGGATAFTSSNRWVMVKTATASAELYDPATGRFSATGPLRAPRANHAATRLADGRVLVLGGGNAPKATVATEAYDPASGTFAATAAMALPRGMPTATALADGRVIVAGGLIDGIGASLEARGSSELYDPRADAFQASAPLGNGVARHTATLLPDGRVLVIGGFNGLRQVSSTAELFS